MVSFNNGVLFSPSFLYCFVPHSDLAVLIIPVLYLVHYSSTVFVSWLSFMYFSSILDSKIFSMLSSLGLHTCLVSILSFFVFLYHAWCLGRIDHSSQTSLVWKTLGTNWNNWKSGCIDFSALLSHIRWTDNYIISSLHMPCIQHNRAAVFVSQWDKHITKRDTGQAITTQQGRWFHN